MIKTKIISIIATLLVPSFLYAAPVGDYQFKSPSFNGVGYSSHVLTIENQERTRQKEQADKLQAAIDKAASDAKNTNLSKFVSNLESRIYAQISQNVATAMFSNGNCSTPGGACSGNIDFQGNYISWSKKTAAEDASCPVTAGTCILMKVADPTQKTPSTAACTDPGMSCVYIPLNSFTIPGN